MSVPQYNQSESLAVPVHQGQPFPCYLECNIFQFIVNTLEIVF